MNRQGFVNLESAVDTELASCDAVLAVASDPDAVKVLLCERLSALLIDVARARTKLLLKIRTRGSQNDPAIALS
jgi:hypothetical protein